MINAQAFRSGWFGQKNSVLYLFNSTFGKGRFENLAAIFLQSLGLWKAAGRKVFQNEGRKYSFGQYGGGHSEKNHPYCVQMNMKIIRIHPAGQQRLCHFIALWKVCRRPLYSRVCGRLGFWWRVIDALPCSMQKPPIIFGEK
jgi:hypothetical protein